MRPAGEGGWRGKDSQGDQAGEAGEVSFLCVLVRYLYGAVLLGLAGYLKGVRTSLLLIHSRSSS